MRHPLLRAAGAAAARGRRDHAGGVLARSVYDDMRAAPDPRAALLEFLQTTYEAGANLGGWDRASLERPASG